MEYSDGKPINTYFQKGYAPELEELAVQALHPLLPLGHLLQVVVGGLLALHVIFLAEDEHDHVRILLDGARFPQVGKLWSFRTSPDLHGPAELRECYYWHVQFFGEAFQRPAWQASITALVPEEQYGRAGGMSQVALGASEILAPLAAGLLLQGKLDQIRLFSLARS